MMTITHLKLVPIRTRWSNSSILKNVACGLSRCLLGGDIRAVDVPWFQLRRTCVREPSKCAKHSRQ